MNEYIQDTLSTPSPLLQQHKYIELIVSLASLIIFFCDGTLSDIYDKKITQNWPRQEHNSTLDPYAERLELRLAYSKFTKRSASPAAATATATIVVFVVVLVAHIETQEEDATDISLHTHRHSSSSTPRTCS